MPTVALRTDCGVIHWWKPRGDKQNIGDFLSRYLLERLFAGCRVKADIYHLIGSVITAGRIAKAPQAEPLRPDFRVAFWGCGCRDEAGIPPSLRHHAIILGIRGPLSARVLGLAGDTPVGDPALLLPLIYQPKQSRRTLGRTAFVPHVYEVIKASEPELLARSGAHVIVSPLIVGNVDAVEDFIDQICSSDFVVTSSLHGAVIAAAYGVPFSFFDCGHVDVPFKWRDFSSSIGVGAYFPRSIEDARTVYEHLLRSQIRRPPLSRILNVAPFTPRRDVLARALAHEW